MRREFDTMAFQGSGGTDVNSSKFPDWVRWACAVWLAAWFAIYWREWGVANFLHVCNLAIILSCLAIWRNNSLLLASQAVASVLGDALWDLDVSWNFFSGHHVFRGTEYMWDAHYALWVRLISLYHFVWPVILIWSVKRVGYDRRGLALQAGIGAAAILAGRLANPALNLNFAFADPIFHRQIGSAPVHLFIIWAVLVCVVYVPTHLVLSKLFPAPVVTGRPEVPAEAASKRAAD
ncbi:MAG TPA: hypothetical protein VJN21_09325 [Candidatus Acidoferrales bacterium]|nr:hypothetical protein [Candidatus Acidoferrales bacterium]